MSLYLECPKKYTDYVWQIVDYLDMGNLEGSIYITTKSNLTDHGLAFGDEEEVEVHISTNREVNSGIWDERHTLAHEMVHVKQHLMGDFGEDQGSYTLYKNKKYHDSLSRENQPWEVEADKIEVEIMKFLFPNGHRGKPSKI